MPLLMGWLAYTLASGLSLYFLVSNVVGVLQYAILGKVNWRNLIPRWVAQPAGAAMSTRGGTAASADPVPTAAKSTKPVKSTTTTPRPRPKRK
jgi:YidC/Oxa1 family membrane protein insertase